MVTAPESAPGGGQSLSAPTHDRLIHLLAAHRTVVSALSLAEVLHTIVRAAKDLTGARYVALGVIGPHGRLDQFIHTGMTEQTVAGIGDLPTGEGLLGAVVQERRTIRLSDLDQDPRAFGFPPGHPPMTSFLGVPIRTQDAVFGNLYLTEHPDGAFSDTDVDLVEGLAATAAIAIDNARSYEVARRHERWANASMTASAAVVEGLSDDGGGPLPTAVAHRVARAFAAAAEAEVGLWVHAAAEPGSGHCPVTVARTPDLTHPEVGRLAVASPALTAVLRSAVAQLVTVAPDDPLITHLERSRSATAVSAQLLGIRVEALDADQPSAALLAMRRSTPFSPADQRSAEAFAVELRGAVLVDQGRRSRQRISLLEDRNRIARDLHDHVIQRLFASGLTVQSVAAMLPSGLAADRLVRTVSDIDHTIGQIRSSIYALQVTDPGHSVRTTLTTVAADASGTLGYEPDVDIRGPVDTAVSASLADHTCAVLQETLSNIARHADSTATSVVVHVDADHLTVAVTDDGRGFSPSTVSHRRGLANLESRARSLGGTVDIRSAPGAGTTVRWTVPLAPA